MIAKVLGCSRSIAARCTTTAFLIDEDVLIDAGTGVGEMDLDAMVKVEYILLSHSRLDRVASLPLFADTVLRRRGLEAQKPVLVYGLPSTLTALQEHIFNGVIWPDFTRLPSRDHPVIRLMPFAVGDVLTIGDKRIEILPADFPDLPAVGFAVRESGGECWTYTCNRNNLELWERLRTMEIAHLVIGAEPFTREAARGGHALLQQLLSFSSKFDVHMASISDAEMATVAAGLHAAGASHRIARSVAGDQMKWAQT